MKRLQKIICFILCALLLASCCTFVACSDNRADLEYDEEGNMKPADKMTTIYVWGWGETTEISAMNSLAQAFSEKYKSLNYQAKFVQKPSNGYTDSLTISLSGSSGPDVFLAGDGEFKRWAELGYIEPLDEYIETSTTKEENKFDLSEMYEQQTNRYYYDANTSTSTGPDAHYYGIPRGSGATAIYYNKAFMDEAGINIISLYENEIDGYNAQNGTSYLKKALFKVGDQWYFNNRIPMNWVECAFLAQMLQTENGCDYGFLTSWWFNYGFSIGGDCIQYLSSDDPAYTGGYYTFTLYDNTVNYKVKEDYQGTLQVNGNDYKAGEIISYEDKFHLDDTLAANCDILPSMREAFTEYMSLAFSDSQAMYSSGIVDTFDEVCPYNDRVLGSVTVKAKSIAPNPSVFKADGRASFLMSGKVAMIVDLKAICTTLSNGMTDEWDVAPMLQYREYADDSSFVCGSDGVCSYVDNGSQDKDEVIVEGIPGAHSGSSSWAIWSKSNLKNAAWLFIEFACGEEGQRLLANDGFSIPNQRGLAAEIIAQDLANGKAPLNQQIFLDGIEYQTPGDWWYLSDSEWIYDWANFLNGDIRNAKKTLQDFYDSKQVSDTYEVLKNYTKK